MTEPEFIATMNHNAEACVKIATAQRKYAVPIVVMCAVSVVNIAIACYFGARARPLVYFIGGLTIGIITSIGVAVHLIAKHRWKTLMETRQQILNHKALIVSIGCLRNQEEDDQ